MREIIFSVETKFGMYHDMIECEDETTEIEIEKLKSDRTNNWVALITSALEQEI